MKPVRALVIDDSLTIRGIIESILLRGNDVEIVGMVSDVEAARGVMEARRPNVITLDLALPGMDGMAFLRELTRYPHAPVIVVSSATTEGSPQTAEALRLGADACFDKARLVQETDRFLRALHKAAARRHRLRRSGLPDAA